MREDLRDARMPQGPGPDQRGARPGPLPGGGRARFAALLGGAGAVTLLALLGLAAFGLLHRHGGAADISGARAGAVGMSLLVATALMLVFKVSHPPAGATA